MALDSKPWYRQPLVWMLICIPATAVVASMITIWLAIESDDGLVADDYYWRGKQINRTLARDAAALQLGLAGRIAWHPGDPVLVVELRAGNATAWPEALELDFLHSTRKGLDRRVPLRHLGGGSYRGLSPELAPGGWHVQLGTPEWRLLGRLFWPVTGTIAVELTAAESGG